MPKFTVIKASAGSGKTFSLIQEYISLILTRPENFRHILAVTFTNKATEEMKSRIIRELYFLSSDKESKQLVPLLVKTGLDEIKIRQKSKIILKQLLHQYSWFSISTIDAFFQRIIRNFTRELGIQEGYKIELDTEPVLTEVIDRLLVNAEHDPTLLKWLSLFAESLIEKGENWNLKKSIRKLGNEIFREEFKNLDNETVAFLCNREYMATYRKELYSIQRQIESKYRSYGQKAMELIKSHGLQIDDFSRKSSGPAGFFAKIASGDFSGPSEAVAEAINIKEKWYTRTSLQKDVIEKLAISDLSPLLKQCKEFYEQNVIQVNTSSVILKNLYTLGILIDLSMLSDNWCSENNTFLLPEAPVFLSRIIDGNDTPFIYEKAGCWFHHFMIDEFQDTSVLQWNNFKPLISNSLSQNFDNLAVGDIKQSIYRWRNSSWEILGSMIGNDFPHGIINEITLNENRRSGENIVNFNNDFFNRAALVLQEEFENRLPVNNISHEWKIQPITDLYRQLSQKPARNDMNKGYVKVRFVDTDSESDFFTDVNNEVVNILYGLLDKGYHMKDIAILTRKNKEAADLAEFLLNYSADDHQPLSVISDEALLLESSVVLNTLISLLRHLVDPADRNNIYYLETIMTNYLNGNGADFWVTPEITRKRQQIKLPEEYLELIKGFKSYSLNEITEQLIRIFDLDRHEGEIVYLMAFRDLIQEYTRNHSSNITRFIEFWDEIGCKRSVAAPAGQDAIRIMTLHKSKGLEFKITIVPYCTWDLNTFDKSFLWCRSDIEPFNKLPVIPINFTRKLANTVYSEDYFRELQKQLIDNLNLMYVAFTRARDALYIFCRESKGNGLGNTSALVKKVLSSNYESGEILKINNEIKDRPCEKISYRQSQKSETARLKIAFQGNLIIDPEMNKPARPISEGRILHEIFNRISVREDIVRAVSEMQIQGKILNAEQKYYIRLIENAMNDWQVSTWFAGDWTILTEAEIILPGGNTRRPDRVMHRMGQTLVVDYKFGLKTEPAHETQVKDYAGLLNLMGYSGVEAYLWYVRLGKVIQVRTGIDS